MSRTKPSGDLEIRVITPMSKEMVDAIADFRFEARCDTKAEAVRRLIALGLEASKEKLRKAQSTR